HRGRAPARGGADARLRRLARPGGRRPAYRVPCHGPPRRRARGDRRRGDRAGARARDLRARSAAGRGALHRRPARRPRAPLAHRLALRAQGAERIAGADAARIALISRSRIQEVAAGGALEPIVTRTAIIDDAGARFVVRVAAALAAKAEAPKPRADPLGDYEPELYVGEVGAAHYALLNKFPVLPEHLLIVTRAAEPQDRLLGEADFAALAAVMEGFDGLGFYNGGHEAGASQGRKRLQLVPLPLATEL